EATFVGEDRADRPPLLVPRRGPARAPQGANAGFPEIRVRRADQLRREDPPICADEQGDAGRFRATLHTGSRRIVPLEEGVEPGRGGPLAQIREGDLGGARGGSLARRVTSPGAGSFACCAAGSRAASSLAGAHSEVSGLPRGRVGGQSDLFG